MARELSAGGPDNLARVGRHARLPKCRCRLHDTAFVPDPPYGRYARLSEE
jgi:hypothetical protein